MTDTLSFPTEASAMDYFRTHGEDVGRPYVVTGYQSAIKPQSEAFRGLARWECGFAGQWPERTMFAPSFLQRPPSWADVGDDAVTFNIGGAAVRYRLEPPKGKRVRLQLAEAFGPDARHGVRV